MTTTTNETSMKVMNVGLRLDGAREALQKFAAQIAEDPAYAFSWAEGAMSRAAEVEHLSRLKAHLDRIGPDFLHGEHAADGKAGTPVTADDVFAHHVGEWTRTVLNDSLRGASTSACRNAYEAASRAVLCDLIRTYGQGRNF